MVQAKGVLPKHDEDTRTLFANPKTCGYFVSVSLRRDLGRAAAQEWLQTATRLVDELVVRLPAERGTLEGEKVAAVAVGLGPSFFEMDGAPRFEPAIAIPAGFESGTPEDPNPIVWDSAALSAVPRMAADVMFYVVSVFEARVARFVEGLSATAPDVVAMAIDRGYQRLEGDEPFGYKDGVRNVLPRSERSTVAFVHLHRILTTALPASLTKQRVRSYPFVRHRSSPSATRLCATPFSAVTGTALAWISLALILATSRPSRLRGYPTTRTYGRPALAGPTTMSRSFGGASRSWRRLMAKSAWASTSPRSRRHSISSTLS